MKRLILLLTGLLIFTAACSSTEAGVATAVLTNDGGTAVTTTRLNDDYTDALPVMTQLAVGTLQLESTDMAVDETLAAEILPLWQAAQSLSSSDTTADIEIEAVLNQIQDAMQPAQVAAIAERNLTSDSLAELMESGAIAFGPGMGRGLADGETEDSGFTPPAGFGAGGGPGGGMPAGGPGGGGEVPAGGGGFGGGLGGDFSEDDMATRQAEFASGEGLEGFQDQAMVGAVIRLLQSKTGEMPENPMAGVMEAVFTAAAEATGLTVEEIQAQLGEGTTLAAVIEANGAEVTAVREAIITALNELPNAAELDVEQITNSWLGE